LRARREGPGKIKERENGWRGEGGKGTWGRSRCKMTPGLYNERTVRAKVGSKGYYEKVHKNQMNNKDKEADLREELVVKEGSGGGGGNREELALERGGN